MISLKNSLGQRMSFKPLNRHILLEPIQANSSEDNGSTILVPEDYKPKISPHGFYKVLAAADDCSVGNNLAYRQVIVQDNMVEQIEIKGETYYLVLENYVLMCGSLC